MFLGLEGMIIYPIQWFQPVTPSTMELGLLSWLRFRSQSQIDAISAVEAGDLAWFRHCCLNCTHSFIGSSCGGWCACGRQRHVHRCMNLSGNCPSADERYHFINPVNPVRCRRCGRLSCRWLLAKRSTSNWKCKMRQAPGRRNATLRRLQTNLWTHWSTNGLMKRSSTDFWSQRPGEIILYDLINMKHSAA